MRVAVLEWVCGGGLASDQPDAIPSGLRAEGWAMLSTMVKGLKRGGCEVSAAIDARLLSPPQLKMLAAQATPLSVDAWPSFDLELAWQQVCDGCDAAIVIAPEIDSVLMETTEHLRNQGVRLLNCSADFLSAASDKITTARLLQQHHVHHPPTRRLIHMDASWLNTARPLAMDKDGRELWVIKPADGAGGEGLRLCDGQQLAEALKDCKSSTHEHMALKNLLVQPWIRGVPMSCSAIADAAGRFHWLPMVSQDFASPCVDGRATPNYVGCSLWAEERRFIRPHALLESTVAALGTGALGWVGIDLLYATDSETWYVIEVNPRCTTSLVGLASAYSGNLALEMLQALDGQLDGFAGAWQPTTYRIYSK